MNLCRQIAIFLWPITSRIPNATAHPSAAIFFLFKFEVLQPPICCRCLVGQQESITPVLATSLPSWPLSNPEVRDLEKSRVTYGDKRDDWIMNQLGMGHVWICRLTSCFLPEAIIDWLIRDRTTCLTLLSCRLVIVQSQTQHSVAGKLWSPMYFFWSAHYQLVNGHFKNSMKYVTCYTYKEFVFVFYTFDSFDQMALAAIRRMFTAWGQRAPQRKYFV